MKASANTFLVGGVAASVIVGSLVACAPTVTLGDAVDSGAPDAASDSPSPIDTGAPDAPSPVDTGAPDAPSPVPAKYLGLVLASVDQSSGTNQYGLFADFTGGPLFTASPAACACSTGIPTGVPNAPTAGAITLSSSAGSVLGTLTPSAAGTPYAGSFFATTTFGGFATVIEEWNNVPSAYPTGGSQSWTAGDALEVSAAGGDVPPFTATLQTGALLAGVTPALGSAPTVVSRNESFAIAWTPGDRPTDRVDLTIRELTTSGAVTCSCTAPDSAGQIEMGLGLTSQLSTDPSATTRLSLTRMTASNIWSGSTSVDLIGEVGLGTSATVSDVGAPDAGPDGTPTPDPSPCPSTTPTAGAACAQTQLVCEYGSDPSVGCDTVMTCSGGVWAVTPIKTNDISLSCSTAPNPAGCPATFADVAIGQVCGAQPDANTSCDYAPQARCVCGQFKSADMNYYWNCDSLVAPEAYCPTVRPRLGEACVAVTPTCDYGSCSYEGGLAMQCNGSIWVSAAGPTCPLP